MQSMVAIVTLTVGLVLTANGATAAEKTFEAEALFAQGVTSHLQMSADGKSIELLQGELIEDDGPAAGYSYRSNVEKLSDGVLVKKQLLIDDPRTEQATLLVGGSGELTATVNGSAEQLQPTGKAGAYWQTYQVPPELLRSGVNEIVLQGEGQVWLAHDEDFAAGSLTRTSHANRSAKSSDQGRTWNDHQLGTDGKLDGEYYVRLFLGRHRSIGTVELPVVDVGNLEGRAIAPALKSLGPVHVRLQANDKQAGSVSVIYRSGTVPSPRDGSW
jgi:hypothetical protein